MKLELPPTLYHHLVRPKFLTNKYIFQLINSYYNFDNKKVLDFGCGIGTSCSLVPAKYYLGVDNNEERINYAQTKYPQYNFQIYKEDLKLKDNSFDHILIISVLHHIEQKIINKILKEFQRILKKDGKIIVIEPCLLPKSFFNNHFMNIFDRGKYIRKPLDYFNLFLNANYKVKLIKRFNKIFYNEILFSAALN